MKRVNITAWAVAVAASAALSAVAETVTVNPPAGSVTNAFAFVSGEDALAVNMGATGGTVRLNPNNSHTGGTTLGSGTLVVAQPAHPEAGLGELGAGPFTQTGGTLRYTGPAGGVWTGAITNQPAVDTAAVVWQIDNDLVMAGDVQQPTGCFIKSGKGTLTFTQPFTLGGCTTSYSGIYGGYTDFSPDRAPTKGYAPFTIADGTVVIDTPYDESVTNVLSGVDVNLAIGQGTTVNGEETTGVLILSNGITRSAGRINVGSTNGRKSNSTSRLQPTLRVLNGATLLVGPTGNKVCYLGVMWSDNTLQWNAPLLEVAGPGSKMWCNGLSISYHKGGNSTVLVRDGGDLSSLGANLTISSNSGSADVISGMPRCCSGLSWRKTCIMFSALTVTDSVLNESVPPGCRLSTLYETGFSPCESVTTYVMADSKLLTVLPLVCSAPFTLTMLPSATVKVATRADLSTSGRATLMSVPETVAT